MDKNSLFDEAPTSQGAGEAVAGSAPSPKPRARRRSPSKPKPEAAALESNAAVTEAVVGDSTLPTEAAEKSPRTRTRRTRSSKPRAEVADGAASPSVQAAEPYPLESPQPSILVSPDGESVAALDAAGESQPTVYAPSHRRAGGRDQGRNRSESRARGDRGDSRRESKPHQKREPRESRESREPRESHHSRSPSDANSRSSGGRFERSLDRDPTSFQESGFIPAFLLNATKRPISPDVE
ncbi:MAG: hypothetical protein QM523_09710 [Candidatus Pacebacteria bacterium]|nr:hypothetical protein [Candidatus Paceibacterota bacterium]